jgi:hypothetical protein
MTKKPNVRRTFDTSVEEAKSIGASVDEVRNIHDIVKKRRTPEGVRDFEVRFGTDATGAPAVWIWFLVDEDANPSPEKVSQLTEFGNLVRSDLLQSNLRYWPYIDFRGQSSAA